MGSKRNGWIFMHRLKTRGLTRPGERKIAAFRPLSLPLDCKTHPRIPPFFSPHSRFPSAFSPARFQRPPPANSLFLAFRNQRLSSGKWKRDAEIPPRYWLFTGKRGEGRLFFFDVTLTSRDTFESLIARKEFTFINSVTVVRSNGL